MSNVYQSTEHEPDNLLLMGQMPIVTDTIKSGAENLKRGSVIGLKSDTGEAYLVDKSKNDGTEKPYGIIAETVPDASLEAVAYIKGEFNRDALIVAEGSTIEDYKAEMNRIGLIVRDVQNRR